MEQLLSEARRVVGRERPSRPLNGWPIVAAVLGALAAGVLVLAVIGSRLGREQRKPAAPTGGAKGKATGTTAGAKSPTRRRQTTRRQSTSRRTAARGSRAQRKPATDEGPESGA